MGYADPLANLEHRPVREQTAVLATEARNQRNDIIELKNALAGVQRALWGLVTAISVGLIGIIATLLVTHNP